MSNGTRPAVLVTEMFSGDGPFARFADDFLASICSICDGRVDSQGRLTDDGAICSACFARQSLGLIR